MDLISKEKPDVLCIQETVLWKQTHFNVKNYTGLFKEGHVNNWTHGGVADFIHESISYQKLTLDTLLQAIVARINIGRDVTIVSICNSRSQVISENLLSTLFQQSPKPVILTGDFNSYHQIWGSSANDNKGCHVLSFISKKQLNILVDGKHTGTSGTSKSAVDHTITSPFLQPILHWNVTDSPLSYDDYMVTVSVQSKNSEPHTTITKFNINKTNCYLLTSNEAWRKTTNPNWPQSAEALTEDFY